jgi:hypothetical protein
MRSDSGSCHWSQMLPGVATNPEGGGGGGSEMTIEHTLPEGQVFAPLRFTAAEMVTSLKVLLGGLLIVSVVVAWPLAFVVTEVELKVDHVLDESVGLLTLLNVTLAPFTAVPPCLTVTVMVELSVGGVNFVFEALISRLVMLLFVPNAQA